MPNPLVFYQKVRFKNILNHLSKLEQAMDVDTLHDLRVELKRVRFIKTILDQHKTKKAIEKAYLPFKQLFKKLGKIRGQYVNHYRLSTAQKAGVQSDAQNDFKKKQLELEFKLKNKLHHYTSNVKSAMQVMESLILQLPDWNDSAFAKLIKKQVQRKLNKKTPDKKLHKARHTLKAVIYSAEISGGMASKIHSTFNMAAVANLEDAIGDWHDLDLLLTSKSSVKLSPKAKKHIQKKKKSELKRIHKLIPNLLSPNPDPL